MHWHRYTPRKARRLLLRPLRRIGWKLTQRPLPSWEQVLITGCPKVSVVVAHPDDELFCSGLVCYLAERGAEISSSCLTRGEGGSGEEATSEETAAIREAELDNRQQAVFEHFAKGGVSDFFEATAIEY